MTLTDTAPVVETPAAASAEPPGSPARIVAASKALAEAVARDLAPAAPPVEETKEAPAEETPATDTPTKEIPAERPAETPAGEEAAEEKDPLLARRLATLAKAEKRAKAASSELARKESELKGKLAQLAEIDRLPERFVRDPLSVAAEMKLTAEQRMAIATALWTDALGDKVPAELKQQQAANRTEQRIAQLEQEIARRDAMAREGAQRAVFEDVERRYLGKLEETLKGSESAELVRAHYEAAPDEVLQVLAQIAGENLDAHTPGLGAEDRLPAAADVVEAYEQHLQTRFAKKLKPPQSSSEKTQKATPETRPLTKTLTQKVTSPSTPPRKGPAPAEERLRRATELWAAGNRG